jgi:Xaa-Pro aminopeptidase
MIDRVNLLRENIGDWNVDAVLISSATNRRWLSGFTGSAGRLLITPDSAILSTDSRYWEQAGRQAPDFTLFRHRDGQNDTLDFLGNGRYPRIGFEANFMTIAELEALQRLEGITWVPLRDTAESLRQVKSDDELARITAAARITDLTVARVPLLARPGLTEKALAWELEKTMRDAGGDRPAFDIIVASGPNSALPHHHPGDRRLQAGDALIIDLGAEVDGYKSDLTRTFYLGAEPDEQFRTVYAIVLAAQEAALAGARAGLTGKDVDAMARDVIAAAGYGDDFGHGLGHAVGLDIHESPRFSRQADTGALPAGAVMTVEPGIYLPGWGGVRIEDLIVLTEAEPRLLSTAPKDPAIPL